MTCYQIWVANLYNYCSSIYTLDDAVIKISIPYFLRGSIAWEELFFAIIEITLRNWTILELGSNTSNCAVSIPGRDTNLNGIMYDLLELKIMAKT